MERFLSPTLNLGERLPHQPVEPTCPERVCRFCGKPIIDWDEDCDGEGLHEAADLQPAEPEMPSILLSETEILAIKKSSNGDIIIAISQASKRQYDKDKGRLPAHDSEVASKVVKKFAEKVIAKHQQEHIKLSFSNLRAMAEE